MAAVNRPSTLGLVVFGVYGLHLGLVWFAVVCGRQVAMTSDLLILACQQVHLATIAEEIAGQIPETTLVVSTLAGVPAAKVHT